MPNQLKMSKVQCVLALRQQGWSFSRIAQELGMHRETVARYVRQHARAPEGPAESDGSKPTEAPPGSSDSKPAEAPPGSNEAQTRSGQPGAKSESNGRSECEPLRELIQAKLDQGLEAKRIHQDLVEEQGFEGSYWSVMRFVRRLHASGQLPFRRMESQPGQEAQVDFGSGAPVITPDGRRRKTHVFRIVLSYSRKGYSEVVFRQDTESFIRALENAFWHWGGVPRTLVIDNLRAAVQKADWYEPELHPKLQSFCQHYGVVILPARPYTPRHKGKIESGIKYVQRNALKGRRFDSLNSENDFLLRWETTVADTRIHGTTQQQVSQRFREQERDQLMQLPLERFPFFHEAPRRVHRDGHVEVDHSYYSVPPEYFRLKVWVRWDSRLVRIFNLRWEEIFVHVKLHTPGQFSTHPAHVPTEKISGVERGAEWLLERARRLGTHAQAWAEEVICSRGVQGLRTVMGLIQLAQRHPRESIDQACEIAVSYGAYRLRSVRQLIQHQAPKQEQLEFTAEHPIIRHIDVYGELVRHALRTPAPEPAADDSAQQRLILE